MSLYPQVTTTVPRTGPYIIKQVALAYAPGENDSGLSLQYLAAGGTPPIQKINALPFPEVFTVMIAAPPSGADIILPAGAGDQFQEPDGSLTASLTIRPDEPVILTPLDTSASGIWDVIRVNEQSSGGGLFEADTFRSQGPSEAVTEFEIADTTDLGAMFIHGVTVSGALSGGGVSGTVNIALNAIHGGISLVGTTAGTLVVDVYGRVTSASLGLPVIHGGIFVPGAVAFISVDVYGRVLAAA